MININDLNQIKTEFIEEWNVEHGDGYPFSERLFLDSFINSIHVLKEATFVLKVNDEFIGFICSKIYNGNETIDVYDNTGFISFIYIFKKYRRQHHATNMLNTVLNIFKNKGIKKVLIGKDLDCIFPGVPNTKYFACTHAFFEKLGFSNVKRSYNLDTNKPFEFIYDNDYTYREATLSDKEELLDFINNNFSKRWKYECEEVFNKGSKGREFVLILDNNKIVAYARINDQSSISLGHNINFSDRYKNLGGIGPLGVDINYRGKNLGKAIVTYGVNKLFERGCSDVLVDWTGKVGFYNKVGFKTICDEFIGFEKIIEGEVR